MADAEANSANGNRHVSVPVSQLDIAERELTAWTARSGRLERGGTEAGADRDARLLVVAMVACVFGEHPGQVEAAARRWARTNSSLGVFARRLGMLRASFGTTIPVHGDVAAAQLGPVLETVTRVATEEWLIALRLPHAPPFAPLAPVRPSPLRVALSRILEDRRHLREAGAALLAGAAAGVAFLALSVSPPPHGAVQAYRPHPQPAPAGRPPAGGRKAPAAALVAIRRPATGGPSSGRAARTLSGSDQGPSGAGTGSQGPQGAGGGTISPLPVGPGDVTLPVPVPALPTPAIPAVPVSVTGVGPPTT